MVRLVDDAADLFVDLLGDLLGIVALLGDLPAQEDELFLAPERARPEAFAHAPLRDHLPRDVRRALDIVLRAGGHFAEDQLLGHVAGQRRREHVLELRARAQVPILFGQEPGEAARHATRDDADLERRVRVRERPPHERMAGLVVRDDALLLRRDDAALALGTGDDPVHRLVELLHRDALLVGARRQNRRLVHQVREVGAGEARRLLRQRQQVDVLVQRLPLGVHLENRLPPAHVGPVQHDLTVEAARAQERGVEDVGAVRRRDDDDVCVGVEAVHLDEDLVQGLLALVVAAAQTSTTLSADGIDFVDKHDARRVALGLVEQVAHAARAHTHEHLDELGAADGEERHASLARYRAREQRLPRARGADEQHAARDARPEGSELLRILQELDDLLQLFLRLVHAGDVDERHGRLVAGEHPGAALPEVHGLCVRALRLPHHEDEDGAEDEERQEVDEQPDPVPELARLLHVDLNAFVDVVDVVVLQELEQIRPFGQARLDGRRVALELHRERLSRDVDALDLALLGVLDDFGERLALRAARRAEEGDDDRDDSDQDEQINEAVAKPAGVHPCPGSRASAGRRPQESPLLYPSAPTPGHRTFGGTRRRRRRWSIGLIFKPRQRRRVTLSPAYSSSSDARRPP